MTRSRPEEPKNLQLDGIDVCRNSVVVVPRMASGVSGGNGIPPARTSSLRGPIGRFVKMYY